MPMKFGVAMDAERRQAGIEIYQKICPSTSARATAPLFG